MKLPINAGLRVIDSTVGIVPVLLDRAMVIYNSNVMFFIPVYIPVRIISMISIIRYLVLEVAKEV